MSENASEQTAFPVETYQVRFPEITAQAQSMPEFSMGTLSSAGELSTAADTNNWDTVFAIKFPDVNAALKKPGACPENFSATDPDSGYTVNGTFGPWQLSGGDGKLLHMDIPISAGNAIINHRSYLLNGAVATIEVELDFIPQPTEQANSAELKEDLKVKTTPDASESGPVVSVTKLVMNPEPSFITKTIIKGLLEEYFNNCLQEFTHVFSTVNLNMIADKDAFQWLKPTHTNYAVYHNDNSPVDSVFGILCMTENRPQTGAHQVSPNAIPAGARSGFLIASERFLEKLVMPGLPSIFQNAHAADFEMAIANTQIRNKNTLTMEPIEINGTNYTPEIAPYSCTVQLNATEVVCRLNDLHVAFSPGIDIYMTYEGHSNLTLVTKTDGHKAINYVLAPSPAPDHHIEVASWVIWTEVAASVLAAVATLGVGAVAKKITERITLRIIAMVITLIVGELIANIGGILDAIATGSKDKLPTVDLIVTNATNPVIWPGAGQWTTISAQLNGSLQFGGDPNFS